MVSDRVYRVYRADRTSGVYRACGFTTVCRVHWTFRLGHFAFY